MRAAAIGLVATYGLWLVAVNLALSTGWVADWVDAEATWSKTKHGSRAAIELHRARIGIRSDDGERKVSVAVGAQWYRGASSWADPEKLLSQTP